MQPPSSFPGAPSPRKKLLAVRWILPAVATVLLVALFAGVFQALRGATNPSHLASGPYVTPTTTAMTTATGTPTTDPSTPEPGATPSPTSPAGNPGTQTGAVRVTQNQNERQACLDDTAPYTVVLFNGGTVNANWHVSVPEFVGDVQAGPTVLSQPLLTSPFASAPYWVNVKPQDGSVAPGQTASFVMTPVYPMPCDGSTYKAAVQLRFPSGTSQQDIPLTYAGTGPSRHSNVVLVSGSLSMTQACPASGVTPDPYTFAIKNTGNGIAYPTIDTLKDTIGPNPWADAQIAEDPTEPVPTWLYPGETWTVTISPHAGVRCDGMVYHTYVYINNTQGVQSTMTFTDVFQ